MPGGEQRPAGDRGVSAEDLPALALASPHEAAVIAREALSPGADAHVRGYAWQALGIAARETGDAAGAVRHLRSALRATAGQADREADVRATLGHTLATTGRTREGLAMLEAALTAGRGVDAARIRMRRGATFRLLGRTDEAVNDLRLALASFRAFGDTLWEARTLTHLALAHLDRGDPRRASEALEQCESLQRDLDQPFEAAATRHNRGDAAALAGDLPAALAHYDAAEVMYAVAGARPPELSADRCAVLLAAGLPADALRHAEEAVSLLRSNRAAAARRADALVRAAQAALAARDPAAALGHAREAQRLYRSQGRQRGLVAARLAEVRARFSKPESSAELLAAAIRAAADAERHLPVEAADAHLLAAMIALARGSPTAAEPHLLHAARARRRGSAIDRVVGWHATALQHALNGRRRGALRACERGLAVLNAHQLTLGGWEMRAAATSHGTDLASLALRDVARHGDARALLRWSERWRATVLAAPPVLPPDDAALAADLTALRQTYRRRANAQADDKPGSALAHERRRLEEAVRQRSLTAPGNGLWAPQRFDVAALLAALGNRSLIEITVIDNVLHVLVACRRRVRRFTAGNAPEILREVEYARFGLRTAAHGPGHAKRHMATLSATAPRLEQLLLGGAARALGDEPVVIVPPARLHAAPWALLPSLRERVFTVTPSAASWIRARQQPTPPHRRVALVRGPGLTSGGQEVERLASRYPDATVLRDGTATSERVLGVLDGVWLAHLATHGSFRADNPLFSTLTLDDGPLTLYDLQRLRTAPYRIILSACDTGVGAATGVDEILGLASVFIGLGTAGLLASVVPVNDDETVNLSLAVHNGIAAGMDLGHALLAARTTASAAEPVAAATALSYVAIGAA